MTRDQRQYHAVRWGLMIYASLVTGLTVMLLWRAWPTAMTPAHSTCGCTVGLAISTAAHGLAQAGAAVALFLLGWLAFGLVKNFYQQYRVKRAADRNIAQTIVHQPTGQTIRIVSDTRPQAYSLGWWRPRVYLTSGLVRSLRKSEITAVVRHEQSHCQTRDPLMATLFQALDQAWGWGMPWIRQWARMATSLRELIADRAATDDYQRTQSLASAMAKLMESTPAALAAMSPNTSRVERLLDHNWQPNWQGWRWSYLVGVGVVVAGLTFFGRAQPAVAQPVPATSGSCRQIQIICQAEIKQRQVQCANNPGRCTASTGWLPARLLNYSPLHE